MPIINPKQLEYFSGMFQKIVFFLERHYHWFFQVFYEKNADGEVIPATNSS